MVENKDNNSYCYDESNNLLYHCSGMIASTFFKNKGFYCSKCLRFYFTPWHLKRHFSKCLPLFLNGIYEIDKNSKKEFLELATELGRISKRVQSIDFSMTDENSLKILLQTILVYFSEGKPLGFITFSKRKFKDDEKWSIDDFCVLEYTRGQKVGTLLFDKMLELTKIPKENIVEELVFCKPSQDFCNFLKAMGLQNFYCW